MIRLRHLAAINPPTAEFDRLPNDAEIPFVPLEAVWPGGVDSSCRRSKAAVSTGYTRFLEGDIVVPKITPTFQADRSTIVRGIDGGVAAGTTELHVVRPGPSVDRRYIRYLLSTRPFLHGGEAEMIGVAGQKRVPDAWLRDLPVPVTDIGQQRAIADHLDIETTRIDALIAKKRRTVGLIEERSRAVRESLFAAGQNWDWTTLGRFVTNITQGDSPQASNVPASDGEWGLLKLSAVKSGRFLPEENKCLPAEYVVHPRLVPRPGDLLVTRSNTPSYVGDACAVTADSGSVVLCDLIYRLRLSPQLLPEFAAQVLLTARSRAHLSSAARGTSQSMVKLRGEDVKATPMPVVPLKAQSELVRRFDRHRSNVAATQARLARQIELLVEHRQALITAAVTGELSVPGVAA